MNTLSIKVGLDGVGSVVTGLDRVRASVGAIGSSVRSVAAMAGGLVGVSVGLASVGQALRSIVGTNATIEQHTVAFQTLLGSAEAAQKRIANLTKIAAETPFELPEIVQASRMLQALTGGALATGNGLLIVGDAAAAASRGIEETSMWIGRLYAGLDSGTPVGEATLRLIEMGLISGDTARELNRMAESGEGVGKAMDIIQKTFAKSAGAMKAQSVTMSGLWSTLKDTANLAFADIGKPLFESLKSAVEASIPLAEGFRDFVNVAKKAWADGKYPEFIGLTVEAGFELGKAGAMRVWDSMKSAMSNSQVWKLIGDRLVSNIAEAMKLTATIITKLIVPFHAVGDYARDALGYAFQAAANGLASMLEAVINKAANWANEKFGTSFSTVSFARETAFQAPDFGRSFAISNETANIVSEKFGAGIDALRDKFRAAIGLKDDAFGPPSMPAWERLKALIEAAGKARKAAVAGAKEENNADKARVNTAAILADLKRKEMEAQRALKALATELSIIEGDFRLTEAEKYDLRKKNLAAQRVELERIVDLLRERAQMEGLDPQTREQIMGRADSAQERLDKLGADQSNIGADPNSVREQMAAASTQLQDEFGTTAQSIARGFKSVIGAAVDSVSGGIQRLIGDTEYWSGKLGRIAGPIMGALTGAVSKMFTEWMAKRALAAAKDIFWSGKVGAAETASRAPGAVLSSISSFGVAAAVGVAAVVAAMAAFGGFKTGGYTGNGGVDTPAGIVHGKEFVFDAPAVERIGVAELEALRRGAPASSTPAPTRGGSAQPIVVATFDTRQDAARWAKGRDAEAWFVDVANRKTRRFRR